MKKENRKATEGYLSVEALPLWAGHKKGVASVASGGQQQATNSLSPG